MALPIKYNIKNVFVRWRATVATVLGIAMVVGVYIMTYPHEKPTQMLRLVIGWGRYAELFKYSSTRKAFYLANENHSAQ